MPVEAKELTFTYNAGSPFETAALDHVNFTIKDGEFIGIIGHTGSGKSTLIQHLNGLIKPTSGTVIVDGLDLSDKETSLKEVRRRIGLVFQYPEYQLFEETVERDIAFGPSNMGLSPGEIRDRVREAADFVGLSPDTMQKSPFELSGGQKRRVAIAGVLAMRPRVLILDEPTAGLDPKGRDQIFHEIAQYHGKTGSTILLVSHSMEDVAKYAKHVLVINDARKIAFGTVDEVFSHTGELVEMGLAVPQITKIFAQLRARGFELSPHVYTVEAARRELLRVLGKGGAQDA